MGGYVRLLSASTVKDEDGSLPGKLAPVAKKASGRAPSSHLMPLSQIERSILLVRGHKVMLDEDLAS